jgi:hypothetical protein
MEEIPFISDAPGDFDSLEMVVPGASGLNVFLTVISIFYW